MEKPYVETALRQWMERFLPVQRAFGIVVAVSGGADSMTLLHALAALREEKALSLLAAHVHHGLRGEQADADEAFVREQCEAMNIPLEVLHTDVAGKALRGEGIEAAGRRIRYDYFRCLAQQNGCSFIATAHTADDNLETVLLHLTRGSSLHGLCGIPPIDGMLIRPLLSCTRAQIEAYCAAHRLSYVTDATNADVSYSRNRVRALVVPQLRSINPGVVAACDRLTAGLREEDAFLDELAGEWQARARLSADRYAVHTLLAAPPVLLRRALCRILRDGGADAEMRHIHLLETALRDGGSVDIAGGVRVAVTGDTLRVCRLSACQKTVYFEMPLCVGSTYEIAGETYSASLVTRENFEETRKIHKNVLNYALDYDKISSDLMIRQRKAGDAFHPVNGVGKTLKKYFNENRVDVWQRERIPLLCDCDGVVLITGYSCDERVKIDAATKRVLLFYRAESY